MARKSPPSSASTASATDPNAAKVNEPKSGSVSQDNHSRTNPTASASNMTDDQNAQMGHQLEAFLRNMTIASQHYQQMMQHYLSKQSPANSNEVLEDQMHVTAAFMEMFAHLWQEPKKLFEFQTQLWDDYMQLVDHSTRRFFGEAATPIIEPDKKDRRFKDAAWETNAGFDFIKQFYLLASRRISESVRKVEGLDQKTQQKVAFYTQQFLDALSPSNYFFTNPEVLRETLESHGENLVRGMENMLEDVSTGAISMTDVKAFEVGKNIGCTPGKVIFENDLMQLIQYEPATEKVHRTPLLMIPAWINKYYILDLRPENSLVKWLVEQGYTVFMVSWVNPDDNHRQKTFQDYVFEGPIAALDAIEKATGEKTISAIGYCLGGTLLAMTLAYMAEVGDKRINSATFYTTLTDFSDAGEISVFIDEEQIRNLEKRMSKNGYLEGRELGTTFNMLRSNDLIWHFYVNNYLLGKDPFPFDLLYWNSDTTRMPALMHSYYLRNMYQKNLLSQPGGLMIGGKPIDLRKVNVPTYFLSTREDHIAPWKSTYKTTQLFSGPVRFVLAASGHVAGVVNPPGGKKKYGHWTHEDGKNPASADTWLKSAEEKEGSWWPDWMRWHTPLAGDEVSARKPGDGKLKPVENAPGRYVKVRV